MKVRDALLALLAKEPAHGYQLKGSYESLTGGPAVNVGQIYQTIDRLVRDGLVAVDGPKAAVGSEDHAPITTTPKAPAPAPAPADHRRITYVLTEHGRAHVQLLLTAPRPTSSLAAAEHDRSTVAIKVLAALALDPALALRLIDDYRAALLHEISTIRRSTREAVNTLAERLGTEADIVGRESELRWLDLAEQEVRNN